MLPPRRLIREDHNEFFLVSDLIHPTNREWDVNKLAVVFNQQDQPLIRSIKLSRYNNVDVVIWPFVRNGIYTVKSGYWVITHFFVEGDLIVPADGSVALKKRIWKLKILPTIKLFLWRLVSGAVPTAARMCTRGIFIDPICQRCCMEEETIFHMLFECLHAKAIWRCANNPLQVFFQMILRII